MIATGLNSMSRGPDVVRVSQRDIEAALKAATERWKPGLLDLSHAIHADPELGGRVSRRQAHQAAAP